MSIAGKGFLSSILATTAGVIILASGSSFAGPQNVDPASRDALEKMRVTKPDASSSTGTGDAKANAAFERLRANSVDRTVRSVRLDPHGQPSGIILSDGVQYVGNPNEKLATVVKPGDPVRVEMGSGDRIVVVNRREMLGTTLGPRGSVDLLPLVAYPTSPSAPSAIGGGPRDAAVSSAGGPRIDDATELGRYAIDGKVELVLTTPSGAPTGLLMDDGTQVQVLPRVADVLRHVHAGDQLRVEGRGTKTAQGTSLWATGITQDRLVLLDLERGAGAPELGIVGRGQQ